MNLRDSIKYIRNRNLWKKSSATSLRQKSKVLNLVDGNTKEKYSLDLAKTSRYRSPYKVDAGTTGDFFVDFGIAEYEEDYFLLDDEIGIITFNQPFSGTPYIVLEIDEMNFGRSVAFVLAVDNEQCFVATPTIGNAIIRYRAIYSPSYPAIANSNIDGPIVVSAGSHTMQEQSSTFSSGFPTGILAPVTNVVATPVFAGNFFADTVDSCVEILSVSAQNNIDNGSISGSVSAPLSSLNEIHYLIKLG